MYRFAIALALLAACHHEGIGLGTLPSSRPNEKPGPMVTFAWKCGADPSHGQIRARLEDGTVLSGTFMQIKEALQVDKAEGYYGAWSSPTWGLADPWYSGSRIGFVTAYTGTTLAHLSSADGLRMRCKFALANPIKGFKSGAEGECQLSDRETLYSTMTARIHGDKS